MIVNLHPYTAADARHPAFAGADIWSVDNPETRFGNVPPHQKVPATTGVVGRCKLDPSLKATCFQPLTPESAYSAFQLEPCFFV